MKRSLSLALLATAALAATACGQKAEEMRPTPPVTKANPTACTLDGVTPRPGQSVAVLVRVDVHTKKAKMDDPTKTARVCEQDTVIWVSTPPGEFQEPVWESENPFAGAFEHGNGYLKSSNPKPGTAGHGHNYQITVKVGGDPAVKVDPRIEVMP